ncbi:RNA-binding S4 domain-containing protein [Auritidibacter ignavus]|uniref:RNA-binding S4 domain-containing protein n=1 Tax=Auritidibacter ignavus TaxID=678932 RepID=UPI00109D21E8|nr:RNA-binding S4 domain-containing protein [Auritidibacter ignavus]
MGISASEPHHVTALLINDDMIRLGQALKLGNLVEDGVQAREIIQDGLIVVNGEVEARRGRQLHPGDVIAIPSAGIAVTIERESPGF